MEHGLRRAVQGMANAVASATSRTARYVYLSAIQVELHGERGLLFVVQGIGVTPETGGPVVVALPNGRQTDLKQPIDLIRQLAPAFEMVLKANIELLEAERERMRELISDETSRCPETER